MSWMLVQSNVFVFLKIKCWFWNHILIVRILELYEINKIYEQIRVYWNHDVLSWFVDHSVGDMSVGRQEAFEIFRRDYYNNPTIEGNKHDLKQRYAEAKSLGEAVNKSRQKISKSSIKSIY